MANAKSKKGGPTIVKKYANRRLYDTGRSSYVTLDDLCEMVQEGHDFVVQDAKSGEDITRNVLNQIIADKENNGEDNLLPVSFLKNLISFYGDSMQGIVPNYLETTFDLLVENQERMREQMQKSMENMQNMNAMNPMASMGNFAKNMSMFPKSPAALDELNRQNIAMIENSIEAMKMFSPFSNMYGNQDKKSSGK